MIAMNELGQSWTKTLFAPDPEIEYRIQAGTEMYRKGFGRLTLKGAAGTAIPRADVRLQLLAHEFHFGGNAFMVKQFPEEEKNRQYEEAFAKIFNLAVVPFFWRDLEPVEGQPRFTADSPPRPRRPPVDTVLDFCDRYGLTPKGHPLCYQSFTPDWVSTHKARQLEQYERHFRQIAERYADRIKIWDVVNEAQTVHSRGRRHMKVPDGHVHRMFELAARYFPCDSVLTYNDDRAWFRYQGDYSPVYLLAKDLLRDGLKLNALGLQYHLADWLHHKAYRLTDPRNLYRCLDQYHQLGLPVNFSEVSIIARDELGDGKAFQEAVTERLYRLWFAHPATNGIIWWNLVDNTGAWESSNRLKAGLLNHDLSEKPAFTMLKRLIREEWHTDTTVAYEAQAVNCFHGFYGRYRATITADQGTVVRELYLGKGDDNDFVIQL